MSSINFLIRAFKDSASKLDKTIESIALNDYSNKFISIITENSNIDLVTKILNSNQKKCNNNIIFNKSPFGVPTFCLVFEKGKIKNSDSLNKLIKETLEYSNLFSVLDSGDLITKNYCNEINDSYNECPNVIGLIYADYILNNVRYYVEPFIKEKINEYWKPRNYIVPSDIFRRKGLFPDIDNCENKYIIKIIEDTIAIHIPKPILKYE